MAEIQVPYWVNNLTRLNATNMNSMSNAINAIVEQLYGVDGDSGLVRTVDTHQMYFEGEANVANSGVFKQIGQLGKVLLTPIFCDGNDKVQAYNYDAIRNYEITLPNVSRYNWWNVGPDNAVESTNPTIKLSLGVSGNDSTPRSLVGNDDSFIKKLADNSVDIFNRVELMGKTYRPKGIFFNPSYNSFNPGGAVKTQVIEAEGNDTLRVTTGIFSVGNGSTALQIAQNEKSDSWIGYGKDIRINNGLVYIGTEDVNSTVTITPNSGTALRGSLSVTGATTLSSTLSVTGAITTSDNLEVAKQANIQTLVANTADIKDAKGNYIQGTNLSSVVVYKTLKDEETRALAAEKVLTDNLAKEVQDRIDDVDAEQGRAEAAELKLTNDLARETANRVEADNQITAAYKKADSDLETKIIGNADDTVEDNTLNGVINYAVAEDEKITAAYTAKDSELQDKIDAINTALSYLADKDVIVSNPDFQYTSSTNIGTVEVGTELTPEYQLQFTAGQYEYGPNPTGVTATSYKVTFNNETLETASGTFSTTVHVTDDMSLTLSAVCKYSDGAVPKNNLGLDYADGKIVSKTVTRQRTLKGYRQAFAGGLSSKDTAIAELDIRGLSGKGATTKVFDVKIDKNATRVVVAFPDSWGTLKSVLDVNDSSKNIVTSFGTPEVVSVSGVTAGEDLMDYKVYVMDFASAYGGSGNTYKITIG